VANALHLAVEQRCGLLLEGSRTSENYVLVRYRVHSQTQGMVDSYKILEEKAENGVYRVKLSVVFRRDVVEAAGLDKLRLALAATGHYLDGGRRVSSDEVASAVKTALVQSGIKLSFVDAGLTPASSERAMKAAARTHRLDLVVLLKSEGRQKAKLGRLILFENTTDLTAVQAVTGGLLATKRIRAKGERKTSNADAAGSAAAVAAKNAADYLLREVVRSRQGAFGVQLFVEKVKSVKWLETLRDELRGKSGVRAVELVSHKGTGAELTVTGDAALKNTVVAVLGSLRNARVEVVRQTPTSLIVRRK
jgi:hypothetical protein